MQMTIHSGNFWSRATGCILSAPLFVSSVPIAVAAWLLAGVPCVALECPTPQPAGAPGAIQETPAQIDELMQVLASGDLDSGDLGIKVQVLVRALRSRHPKAPSGELVNYVVTAYCPIVNGLIGLTDGEKQARIDSVASQAVEAAY